jgi:cell division transport system permease protein
MVHFGIAGFLTDLLAGQGGMIGLIGTGDLWLVAPFLVGGALLLAIVTSWMALLRHVRV